MMKCIILLLLLSLAFSSNGQDEGVCFHTVSVQRAVTTYTQMSRVGSYCCGWFCWGTCYRINYEQVALTRYITQYETQIRCCLGYKKNVNGVCKRIDDCSEDPHRCEHFCSESPARYSCSCFEGAYQLSSDGSSCTSTMSIEQGIMNTRTTVVGLATVDLGAPTYFDCTTTQGNGASLEWSVPPGSIAPISDINNGKRVSFDAISMGDLGVYTCMDPVSGESVEFTLITDVLAVTAPKTQVESDSGDYISLLAYVAGRSAVEATDISWYYPNGTIIVDSSLFRQESRRLFLGRAQLNDGGMYRVEVRSDRGTTVSAAIELVVQGCVAETTSHEDGIVLEWPQSGPGAVALPCPCGELPPGSTSREATRMCQSGGIWAAPMYADCRLSSTESTLCQLSYEDDSEVIVKRLSKASLNSGAVDAAQFSIITTLLEKLVRDSRVLQDRGVVTSLLGVVNNLIQIDEEVLQISQAETKATARLLNLIDTVAINVPIPENETSTVIPFSKFAIAAQQVETVDFNGQLFSAIIANNSQINSGSLSYDDRILQSDGSIAIPDGIFMELGVDTSTRISNAVYLSDSLFPRQNSSHLAVGGIIISATIGNRTTVEMLNSSIVLNFTKNPDVESGTNASCNFWDPSADDGYGDWSSRGCRVAEETDEMVTCECDHLTNFAILLDVSPLVGNEVPEAVRHSLSAVSYIGIVISTICIFMTILTYLISKKLRNSKNAPLLICLCTSLLGIYAMFFVSILSPSQPRFCSVIGAGLHYFMLVTFFTMAAEALDLFLHLVIVIGIPSVLTNKYPLKAAIITWGLPVVIVLLSFAPNWMNYYNEEFCRPYGLPFFVGLITPFIITYAFIIIMFLVIFISLLCKSSSHSNSKESSWLKIRKRFTIAITLSVLFGIGWIIGLAATQRIPNLILASILQFLFIIFTAFHGLFLFIMYSLRLEEARDEWKLWISSIFGMVRKRKTIINQYISGKSGTASTDLSSGKMEGNSEIFANNAADSEDIDCKKGKKDAHPEKKSGNKNSPTRSNNNYVTTVTINATDTLSSEDKKDSTPTNKKKFWKKRSE